MLEIVSTSHTDNGTLYLFSDGTLVRLDPMGHPTTTVASEYQKLIQESK